MAFYQALADGSADKGEHILPAGGFEPLKNPKMMHAGAVTAIKIQPSTELLYSGGADRCIKVPIKFRSMRKILLLLARCTPSTRPRHHFPVRTPSRYFELGFRI